MSKTILRCTAPLILFLATPTSAEVAVNLGFASDYYYRGVFQAESSASGGVDYANGGFYAGAWAADVKEGLEVDGYFGYSGTAGDFGYSIGYTGYFYTQDFDDTYQEINLGASYGFVTFDVAVGEYANFTGPTQDYTHFKLGLEKNGFFAGVGGFSQDFDGEYFEFGYGATVADIDLGVSLLVNDKNLDLVNGEGTEALIFTVGKTFGL